MLRLLALILGIRPQFTQALRDCVMEFGRRTRRVAGGRRQVESRVTVCLDHLSGSLGLDVTRVQAAAGRHLPIST